MSVHHHVTASGSTFANMQAVKQSQAGLTESLIVRVNISRAIVQVMLEGPLTQHSSPSLHRQALRVLNQLHMLHNFLDG